jgi:mannan endo-1,4-beta-mannosidase
MPAAPTATPRRQLPQCLGADAKLGCSFAQLSAIDKPLLVGEAGIGAHTAAARRTRAMQLPAKMRGALAGGASGYLLWHVTKEARDQYAIVLGTGDPVLDELADVADGLGPNSY